MTQPTLLAIAKADLLTAGKLVNSSNKFQKHQAAYMTQQSIEKTLKYLIEIKTGTQPWGHDIRKLVNEAKKHVIYVPKRIDEKAEIYTNWEVVARYYPTRVIYRNTIKSAIDVTHKWHIAISRASL